MTNDWNNQKKPLLMVLSVSAFATLTAINPMVKYVWFTKVFSEMQIMQISNGHVSLKVPVRQKTSLYLN